MKKQPAYNDILKRMFRFCAYRERGILETENKLKSLGANENEIEEIIKLLKKENFLNEKRYVDAFILGKNHQKNWGKNKIYNALKLQKIPEQIINDSLKILNKDNYEEQIIEILKKKDKTIKDVNPYIRKQKLANYLVNKGYETDLVWSKINEIYAD